MLASLVDLLDCVENAGSGNDSPGCLQLRPNLLRSFPNRAPARLDGCVVHSLQLCVRRKLGYRLLQILVQRVTALMADLPIFVAMAVVEPGSLHFCLSS